MPQATHLILIGPMASGKTTVGRRVAKHLGRRFLDSDECVLQAEGRTIHDIASDLGIAEAHRCERDALRTSMLAPRPSVLAAAASVVDDPHVRDAIVDGAFVVWLRARAGTLRDRMKNDPHGGHRPILGSPDGSAPGTVAAGSTDARGRLFAKCADVAIDVDDLDPEEIADRIAEASGSPRLVCDAHAICGEGPLWTPQSQSLWWVDITGQRIHRHHAATGENESWETAVEPTALALGREGDILVTTCRGIERFHPSREREHRLSVLIPIEQDEPETRTNDAKCDRAGRFWVDTLDRSFGSNRGRVYRVEPDGHTTIAISDATLPNGMCWSRDDRTFYWIDTTAGVVRGYAYDPSSGTIGDPRIAAPTDGTPLQPDGMTIDDEGGLWVATLAEGPPSTCSSPGGVVRFLPDGSRRDFIPLPATFVTSVCFGGEDGRDLYITTGPNGIPKDDERHEPHAGGLFRWRADVAGEPLFPFAG